MINRVALNAVILESMKKFMPISALLVPELDQEMKSTRTTLERVPSDKPDFSPPNSASICD
jgi:hypothetical protein